MIYWHPVFCFSPLYYCDEFLVLCYADTLWWNKLWVPNVRCCLSFDKRPNTCPQLQITECYDLARIRRPHPSDHVQHSLVYLTLPPFFLRFKYLWIKAFNHDLILLVEDAHYEVVVWRPFKSTQDFIEDKFFLNLQLIWVKDLEKRTSKHRFILHRALNPLLWQEKHLSWKINNGFGGLGLKSSSLFLNLNNKGQNEV